MKKSKVLLLLASIFTKMWHEGWRKFGRFFDVVCLLRLWFAGFDGNASVAAGWCGFCWVVKTSCVVCFVHAYQLWNFALDGEQKWKNVDLLDKFCWDMSRDLQQTFKVWLVDYLTEFGVQMIKFSSILAMFYFRMVGDDVWDECLIILYW